jgi:Protein kinase domain
MTVEVLSPLERGLKDMREAARTRRPVRADAYLSPDQAVADPELAVDLVYAEYLIRSEAGDQPSMDELVSRFPPLADRVRRQLSLHLAMESAVDTLVQSDTPSTLVGPENDPPYIGRYRVLHRLGRGGQATAYRAFHPDLQRDVVVKLAHEPSREQSDALRIEARAIASLDHPGLVRIYDFDTHAGQPFIVMEYSPARTLAAVAAAEHVSHVRAAEMVTAAARACGHAHRHGVVHRDLKPENVLLEDKGSVRVIDFGLATLLGGEVGSEGGRLTGTLRYMAPEQALREATAIGPRTDVFGLGGVMYFLLTGSPLYSGDQAQVLKKAAAGEWDRSKLAAVNAPARVKFACAKALATNPTDRYCSAEEFAIALSPSPYRRWPVLIGVVTIGLVFGAAVWHFCGSRSDHSTTATTPAQQELQVRVWDDRQGRYRQLLHMLPLATGERVRYEVNVPANRHLALFAIDPGGEVRQLVQEPPQPAAGVLGYPADPAQASELIEPAGTVVFLLCGRAERPVLLDEVKAAFGEDPWPMLPKGSIVQVERNRVSSTDVAKAAGPPIEQSDPEGEILRRLDVARIRLGSTCDVLAGVAYSHR